ncbi:MAG: hypothetical protein KIH10_16015 [Candidatus Freyarchaeota archaeon]|nr:hypothetical protein [Candidatus Jordarchaeia archaeon]
MALRRGCELADLVPLTTLKREKNKIDDKRVENGRYSLPYVTIHNPTSRLTTFLGCGAG